MSKTVLLTVQDFCGRMGLPVPTAIIGGTETSVVQYKGILHDIGEKLSEYAWQVQKLRKTFTSIAAEDQGALTTIIGADYRSIVPLSVWDETLRRPLFGPVGDASWESLKAFTNTGPMYQYWISGGHFLTNPALPAGHTIGLIYETNYPFASASGTAQPRILADTDVFLFPDVVITAEFEWRWKKIKGEPWQDDYNMSVSLIAKNIVKDTLPILQLDAQRQELRPGIWVPAGNWGVS